MSNPGQYMNYQYLVYPSQQINMNYPSLTQPEEGQHPPEVNDTEELNNIVQYIKNLKDPEKREEVSFVSLRHSTCSAGNDKPTRIYLFCSGTRWVP